MRRGLALPVLEATVVSEWVDYNGHMNDAAYAIVFSRSIDALMDRVGLDAAARKRTGQSLFTLQMMLHYFKEAKEGDALAVTCHLLEHDDKRMRVWLDMTAPGGEILAASEQLLISVAQAEGGPEPPPGRSRPRPRSTPSPRRRAAWLTRRPPGRGSRSSARAEAACGATKSKPGATKSKPSATKTKSGAIKTKPDAAKTKWPFLPRI